MKRKKVVTRLKEASHAQSPNYVVMLPFYNKLTQSNVLLVVNYIESSLTDDNESVRVPIKGYVSV